MTVGAGEQGYRQMESLAGPKRRATLITIVFVAVILAALLLALASATRHTDESRERVNHTEQVLRTIAGLREQLARAESSQRGFLLSLDPSELVERDAAIAATRMIGAELSRLVADNPSQIAHARQLSELVQTRINLMDECLSRYRSQGADAARDLFNSGGGSKAYDRILMVASTIGEFEERLLTQRREREREGQVATHWILVVASFVAFLLFARAFSGFLVQSRARRRAEERLLNIVECLPGAVYQYRLGADGSEGYEFLSRSAERVRGIDRAEVLRDPARALDNVLEMDRPRFNAAIADSAATLSELSLEFRIRATDGSTRWLYTSAIPAREANASIFWSGFWSDITKRKLDEQSLSEAMTRLEQAQQVAALGDWTYRVENGELTWSKQMFAILERDVTLGPPSFEESRTMFGIGGATMIDKHIEAVLRTGQPQTFELSAHLTSGAVVHLYLIALPWRDDHDRIIGARGTMQDISERKAVATRLVEACEQADAANRAKSVFLATMSHEIRTPMNGVLGMLELLSLTPLNTDQRSALEVVRESGKSLQRVIDDILDFSKIEAGKLDIHPEPTSIRRVVESVRQIYSGTASSLGLTLSSSCDEAISPALQVDGLRLRQILNNFTSNGIKFTQVGHVDIRAELIERVGDIERVRFTVEDSGIGISQEDQRQLFQPFTQAPNSPGTRFGGTGLGLAICRRLAELMGGSIEVRSATGSGTAMSLILPMVVANPADLTHPAEPSSAGFSATDPAVTRQAPTLMQARATDRVVMVVDDHPINRVVLQGQLNTLGYATVAAQDGADALSQWQAGGVGLILSDVNMPAMSGYELSRRVRALETLRGLQRTPIIAWTANVLSGEVENCLGAGMDDYLAKPTSLTQLLQKTDRWLPLAKKHHPAPSVEAAVLEPAHESTSVPLDRAVLHILTHGDLAATRRILDHFRKVNDSDVESLLDAIAARDFAALAHCAHRIKGASKMIGATSFSLVCDCLEQAGRASDAAAIDACLPGFHRQLEQLNGYLDAGIY
jgi:PAS domain S-box-containing protein